MYYIVKFQSIIVFSMPESNIKSEKQLRVATLTMYHTSINYGGVLQTYALQKVLTKMGCLSTTLRYHTTWNFVCDIKKEVWEVYRSKHKMIAFKSFIQKISKLVIDFVSTKYIQKTYLSKKLDCRRAAFSKFTSIHISDSNEVYSDTTLQKSVESYDAFIVGSDQVWNPYLFTPGYGLGFVPNNKLKISYAASIAQPSLTQSDIEVMRPYISRFDKISVRELRAKELLREDMNLNAECVLDPTMLLTEGEWSSLINRKVMDTPYIFCYILGAEKDKIDFAKKTAEALHLPLVTLPFVSRYMRTHQLKYMEFGDEQFYDIDPAGFLDLVQSAEYVITDSFHGTAFSILYHKRFIVLDRNSSNAEFEMNSRLQSIISLFNIGQILVSDYSNPGLDHFKDIDYDAVDRVLTSMRKVSMDFLESSLFASAK